MEELGTIAFQAASKYGKSAADYPGRLKKCTVLTIAGEMGRSLPAGQQAAGDMTAASVD